jgi:transposase
VAYLAGLSWGTVKAILKADLDYRAQRIDWSGVTHVAIDEISYGSGQKSYLTVVMDLNEDRVLYVHEGRDMQALARFFKVLRRKRTRLQAIAMDMHEPYRLAVREYYKRPCAIVYDRFHVMKLLNEHLDEIRREEVRKAEADGSGRYLKGLRYVVLRANENLKDDGRVKLQKLFAINEPLSKAYILKEQLRTIWRYVERKDGELALRDWISQAEASGLDRLRRFAATLKVHWEGILAVFDQPISTGPLEGLNNAIKVLKRRAFGFRDLHFFKLRILFVHECKVTFTGA